MIKAIQYISQCKSNQEAQQTLEAFKLQERFITGRIIRENKIQIFFPNFEGPLPDNCRRVLLPNNF